MPLPETGGSQAWPPLAYEQTYRDMEVNNAWYSGDIDALETLYSTTRLIRRSGLWGQAKRFFFGTPVPGQTDQRPVKLHLPIPAEIARMSSQLLFGEMPKVLFEEAAVAEAENPSGNSTAGDDDDTVPPPHKFKESNDRLLELLDDSFHAALLEAGELSAALGGSFLRVTWDKSVVPDKPFVTMVAQDAAVADFRFGRLTGVTFWSDLPPLEGQKADTRYRLLERHEPGSIEWGLFQAANAQEIGIRVPLTEHPSAAPLADVVDMDSKVATGTQMLTAVYIPNVKPVRMQRKDPVASNYGRSDFESVDDLFDAFDECYTSWMRDIRLGKSRIFVAKDLLDVGKAGAGAYFDADKEVYVTMNQLPSTLAANGAAGAGGNYVQAEQFKIRYQEHSDTAQQLLIQIYIAAGYSPQTFGVVEKTGSRTVTATQVQFQERISNLTRGSKLLYIKPQLQALVSALMDVDQYVFKGPGRKDTVPEVTFPDTAAPALDALAQSLQLLRAAEAASTETLVQMLNPDWSMSQVLEEVNRIHTEMSQMGPALPGMPSIHGGGNEFAAHGDSGATGSDTLGSNGGGSATDATDVGGTGGDVGR